MKSDELIEYIKTPKWDRIFRIKDALMQGVTIKTIVQATFIDRWFIYQIQEIVRIEKELIQHTLDSLPEELLKEAKQNGFGDEQIARILIDRCTEEQVYEKRKALGITRVYKMVDTCSAEFEARTPYFYSSFEG
jgi:carbamoyl-phosphate synthase large subunit